MLEVQSLTKKFGNRYAVRDLSFYVQEGQIFAFFGKNGAGKTTTMNLLSTLLAANSGKFSVEKKQNPDQIRRKIGIVFQENTLDDALSVRQNLEIRGQLYHGSLKQAQDIAEKLSRELGFQNFMDCRYGKLSGGQKRIVQIARALVGNPRLLILDEPTVGLDPQMRAKVWKILKHLRDQRKMTIFFSSHYMEEAGICDSLCIIEKGKICCIETPQNLKKQYSKYHLHIKENGKIWDIEPETLPEAMRILKQHQNLEELEFRQDTLDDIFIKMTEKQENKRCGR